MRVGDRVSLTMEPIGSGIPGKPETLTLHGNVVSIVKGVIEVKWDNEIGTYFYGDTDDLKVVS